MALFRRKPTGSAGVVPIVEFWRWWAERGAAEVAAAVEGGNPTTIVDALSARVSAIDAALEWELSRGRSSRHCLTVTGAGDPLGRRTAERWLRAEPRPDATWEFSPARRPDENFDGSLSLGDVTIALADTRVAFERRDGGTRIDVTVHHPAFGALGEQDRMRATYLLLDGLLGEDDVERWLGEIGQGAGAAEAVPAPELRLAVLGLAADRPSEEEWTLARGEDGDGVVAIVRTQLWLRWLDHPLYDLHTKFAVPYRSDERGLPADGELDRLNGLEDELLRATTGWAQLATVITSAGQRTFEVYSDSEDQNHTAGLVRLAAALGATVEQSPDPTWRRSRVLG